MKERVFNLFLFCTDDIIRQLGAICHEISGSDEEKLAFLQSRVSTDFPTAKRYPVPDRYVLVLPGSPGRPGLLRYQTFRELASVGKQIELFEEIFEDQGAPRNPMMCVTPIVDGQPRIESFERWSSGDADRTRAEAGVTAIPRSRKP
jgi:hypothetical protein